MHSPLPVVEYKRVALRHKKSINWRKIALILIAVLVMLSMLIMDILALLPATP